MGDIYKSYAKVNMFLHVTGKRKDGYHYIRSLMSKISLFDTMQVFVSKGDYVKIECPVNPRLEGPDNLIAKAAGALLNEVGLQRGIHVKLDKRIPIGAGLGGGSSNAACMIRALNGILKLGLEEEKMSGIGARIGADVPFFIRDGWALVEGIGDIIEPLQNMPVFEMVLLYPGFEVSTREVYKRVKVGLTESVTNDKKPISFRGSEVVIDSIHNDLERYALEVKPEIGLFLSRLRDCGALKAAVSGSGSCVFGIFENKQTADRAFDCIKGENFDCGEYSANIKVFRVTTID